MNVDDEEKFIEGVMILWSRGMNTADIAKVWICRESEIEKALHVGLERRKKRIAGEQVSR